MDEKKLLEKYIRFFGDDPPFPPVHIMKTLVEWKIDGTFDEKIEQSEPYGDSFQKIIEDVTGEELTLEHWFYEIDFGQIEERQVSLDEFFDLLTDSVENKNTQELVEIFKKIGMKEIPFQVEESVKNLPEYKSGYLFKYNTDNDGEYLFEILDQKNEILQISLEINSKFLDFINLDKHLKILKEKCDQKFGFSSPRENKEMTLIQYDTAFLMVGIQMIKPKNREINFRVGNKALWARIFKEELESS